jgi:hypothetical protein
MEQTISPLLIQEPPLQVLPSLALVIGLNEAIVLQQLHYLLLQPTFGRKIAEYKWIFNTVEEWRCQYFPFWSEETIKRAFTSLSKAGLVVSCQPEGSSRRKYYRIDHQALLVASQQVNLTSSNRSDCALPINTKTTYKEEEKGSSLRSEPKPATSESIQYPTSEEEMYDALEAAGIEPNPDYDGKFYQQMRMSQWKIRGKPVHDWIALYKARVENNRPKAKDRKFTT